MSNNSIEFIAVIIIVMGGGGQKCIPFALVVSVKLKKEDFQLLLPTPVVAISEFSKFVEF